MLAVPPLMGTVALSLPLLNVTVPVGMLPNGLLTVAVNVTNSAKLDGFGDEVNTVVVKVRACADGAATTASPSRIDNASAAPATRSRIARIQLRHCVGLFISPLLLLFTGISIIHFPRT
jgi:hypothetical protein